MSSPAAQSQVGVHNPQRVRVQNPDRAATLDSWPLDCGLLAALIATIIFFAGHLL
jgi:hypothetical protein